MSTTTVQAEFTFPWRGAAEHFLTGQGFQASDREYVWSRGTDEAVLYQVLGGSQASIMVKLICPREAPIQVEAEAAVAPYPCCREPFKCAGKGYCTRDPACNH